MIELKDIPSLTANKPAREIDFEKEFVLDTPWMVKDYADEKYRFAFACAYLPMASQKFVALARGIKSKHAPCSIEWAYARHLTKEEEIKYLGVK